MFEVDVTVGLVRDLNNTIHGKRCDELLALYCSPCRKHYTADLARYFNAHDSDEFACSDCDGALIFAPKPATLDDLPITQRMARRYATA